MRPPLALLAGLVACALCATPVPAIATWPTDAGDFLSVCSAPGDQLAPVTCTDGSGGLYVAWLDGRVLGCACVFVQHVLEQGDVDPEWPYNGLPACSVCSPKSGLQMVPDAAGGVILSWSDLRAGQYDVYAQRVTAWGSARWTAAGIPVCTEAGGAQALTAMISDGNGGALMCWGDTRAGASNSDIYAQRVDSTGASLWTTNGVAVCSVTGNQYAAVAASDSAGGLILAWTDERTPGTSPDIYAQRLYASGAPAWTTNGVAVCALPLSQGSPAVCTDGGGGGGGGGAVIAWVDGRAGNNDVYVNGVTPTGSLRWGAAGVPVCTAAGSQGNVMLLGGGGAGKVGTEVVWMDQRSGISDIYAQRLTPAGTALWAANGVGLLTSHTCSSLGRVLSDDSTGMYVVWVDTRDPDGDIYAQRVDSTGTSMWAANGVAVVARGGPQIAPSACGDGYRGLLVAWQDGASSGGTNEGAQRMAPRGKQGHDGPKIISVKDIPNDQGGKVRLAWSVAELEDRHTGKADDDRQLVTKYWIWRQVPAVKAPGPARAAAAGGARRLRPAAAPPTYYWEFVTEQPAGLYSSHSYVAATMGDSVGGSNPYTLFLVEARDDRGRVWSSDPDSGYSVDNLPPAKPSWITGNYAGSGTALHWARSIEADLACYRLYRGEDPGFTPGPASLVVEKPDTGYVDAVAGGHYYKLCAVDSHGNVSLFATLTPQQAGEVPGDVPAALWLGRAAPNPSGGSTHIAYGLPRDARVSLTVHDAAGRLVRSLLSGTCPAGNRAAAWDGTDDAGRRVASGLYLYRLTSNGRTLTGRLVISR